METTTQGTTDRSELACFLENCADRLAAAGWPLHAARVREEADALAALTPEVVAALKAATARPAIRLLPDESERIELGLRALAALAAVEAR